MSDKGVLQGPFSLGAEEGWCGRSIPHIRDYLKGPGFLTNATPGEPQFLHNRPFKGNRWGVGHTFSWPIKYILFPKLLLQSNQLKCKVGIVVIWNAVATRATGDAPHSNDNWQAFNKEIQRNYLLSDYLVFMLFSEHFGTTFWVEWVSCRIPSV